MLVENHVAENFKSLLRNYRNRGVSASKLARQCGISRTQFYRIISSGSTIRPRRRVVERFIRSNNLTPERVFAEDGRYKQLTRLRTNAEKCHKFGDIRGASTHLILLSNFIIDYLRLHTPLTQADLVINYLSCAELPAFLIRAGQLTLRLGMSRKNQVEVAISVAGREARVSKPDDNFLKFLLKSA